MIFQLHDMLAKVPHEFTTFNMIEGAKKKEQEHNHIDAVGSSTKQTNKLTKTKNIPPVASLVQ